MTHPMNGPARIATITVGLTLAGAVTGAICAGVSVACIAAIEGGAGVLASAVTLKLIALSAGFGAVAGAIAGPSLAWGLLRHVPFGRAIAFTALGTVMGSIAGELFRSVNPFAAIVPGVIAGAIMGFLLAGIALRLHAER